jgi:hypothetical protein
VAADLYFRGINVNGATTISRDDFEAFARATLTKGKSCAVKLMFRAFDQDRSGALGAEAIQLVGKYLGLNLTDEEITGEIKRFTGDRNSRLSYAQLAAMLVCEYLPDDADPYDGTNPPKDEEPLPEPGLESAPAQAIPSAAPRLTAKHESAAAASGRSLCCLLL